MIVNQYHLSHEMADLDWKGDEDKIAECFEYERLIVKHFGLPPALRFTEIVQFFSLDNTLTAKSIQKLLKKLKKAATRYFLDEPVLTDNAMLHLAQEKEIPACNVLPILGFENNSYETFLIDELLIDKKKAPEKILKELNVIRNFTDEEQIAIYHNRHNERKLKQIANGRLKYILDYHIHELFKDMVTVNPFMKE